jgi:hypothetical protein
MDENLASRIRTCGLPTLEIDARILAAVAIGGGRVVLMQGGQPVAAVVGLEDLGFVLDAEAAEQEDTLRGDEDPPSGSHRGWGH